MRVRTLVRSFRVIHSPTLFLRRNFTTTPHVPRSLRPKQIIATSLLVGAGIYFYTTSQVTLAEVQSSKTSSANDNREATAQQARKNSEKPGKAEKEANKSGNSSQDLKAGRQAEEHKPQSGAGDDSKTGKIKGGHDSDGKPKDDKLKSGKVDKSEKSDKSNGTDDEEEEGPQAFGILSKMSLIQILRRGRLIGIVHV